GGVDGEHPIVVCRAVLDLEIDEMVGGQGYTVLLEWFSCRGCTIDAIACQAGVHDGSPVENDAPIADALDQARWHGHRRVLSLRDNTRSALSPRCSPNEGKQHEGQCQATG